MKRLILILMLLLPIETISARSFSGGALAGGIIGGFAAGALVGNAIGKRRCRKKYYDYPPCTYNYYGPYNPHGYNTYL